MTRFVWGKVVNSNKIQEETSVTWFHGITYLEGEVKFRCCSGLFWIFTFS